jgi:hypothetical protein
MDDPAGMGVGHRLADGLEDRQEPGPVGGGRGPLSQECRQRPALDQLHREIRAVVGKGAQLVDRHDPGMLKLAADLRFLDEPAHQFGPALVTLQQHLDGQVAAQVGISPLEHGSHAAAGDLAQELHPHRAIVGQGHLVRRRANHRPRVVVTVGVAQEHPRHRATGGGQGVEDPARSIRREAGGGVAVGLENLFHQAARAEPGGRRGRPRAAAAGTSGIGWIGHGSSSVTESRPVIASSALRACSGFRAETQRGPQRAQRRIINGPDFAQRRKEDRRERREES